MLTVTLYRGSAKNHATLLKNVPQNPPRPRRFVLMAVIHEEGTVAGVNDAKVMLYQETEDTDHYWIRKETCDPESGRTSYAETDTLDALTAIGGFDTSVRLMLDRLLSRREAA